MDYENRVKELLKNRYLDMHPILVGKDEICICKQVNKSATPGYHKCKNKAFKETYYAYTVLSNYFLKQS